DRGRSKRSCTRTARQTAPSGLGTADPRGLRGPPRLVRDLDLADEGSRKEECPEVDALSKRPGVQLVAGVPSELVDQDQGHGRAQPLRIGDPGPEIDIVRQKASWAHGLSQSKRTLARRKHAAEMAATASVTDASQMTPRAPSPLHVSHVTSAAERNPHLESG